MKAKKVLAMLMASAMIMGTTVTAFAAPGNVPSTEDKKNVYENISGIEEGATIKAYRIIEPKYTDDGFAGYKWVNGVGGFEGGNVEFNDDEEVVGLNDTLITNIASNETLLNGLTSVDNIDDDTDEATENLILGAGTWLLIVEDEADVYNPMIISVYYSKSGSDSTMVSDSVDADERWELYGTTAYAKSTPIDIEKNVDADDVDAEVYSSVSFTITGTIPAYSEQYTKDVVYVIKDTFTNGLTMNEIVNASFNGKTFNVSAQADPVVKVNGVELTNGNQYTYTHIDPEGMNNTWYDGTPATNEGFQIQFSSEYIKGLKNATAAGRAVEVTYNATVTPAAVTVPAENDVALDYTHTPNSVETITDEEKVYSVSLDGLVTKVDEDNAPLDGAEFTLYRSRTSTGDTITADELTDEVGVYTTGEDGDIEFKGLDADTPYYLTETGAPQDYSLNDAVYVIEFTDVIDNGNGTYSYTVKINGKESNTITYGQSATSAIEQIVNTRLGTLPSTGGIGTTIFTIGGCVIMVTAAGLYFATRKKEQK